MVISWLRAGTRRLIGEPAASEGPAIAAGAQPSHADLLASADRASRIIEAVYQLAAGVESEARGRGWSEGDILVLFRDGMSVWSTLAAYGILRYRHDLVRRDASPLQVGGQAADWTMASAKLAEQVAGTDAAGSGDAGRLKPTIENLLRQYDSAAARSAASGSDRDSDNAAQSCGPLHELIAHGFGGPGSAAALAERFDAWIDGLAVAADRHVLQIYG